MLARSLFHMGDFSDPWEVPFPSTVLSGINVATSSAGKGLHLQKSMFQLSCCPGRVGMAGMLTVHSPSVCVQPTSSLFASSICWNKSI